MTRQRGSLRRIIKEKIGETREKLENYEFVVKVAETNIVETQTRLKKEQIEKHKLLNDPNETVRNAAQELYDRILHASRHVVATTIERKIKKERKTQKNSKTHAVEM